MRFLSLDLRAFGPFADAPILPLDGGERGLHLIHGPNEAGKSTALRAIRCLLFGFPKQTGDNHRVSYDKLRVGATLRDETGADVAFLRRKRDVKPLWTLDDATSLPDDLLARALAGLDQDRFNQFFAMDHDELVQGGRLILQGKGLIAEMLFAAGSGLARVDEVKKGLEAEIDSLFKKTGTNPRINAGLTALKQANDAANQAMLATGAWVELDALLAAEVARRAEVEGMIREIDRDKRRLERLRDALPLIARRNMAGERLGQLGAVPLLSEGFADRRFEALASLNAARLASRDARQGLEAVDRDLDLLGPPDPTLLEADAIQSLRGDLGLYRKALDERPAESARLARLEAEAHALLGDLRRDATPAIDAARVPPALKERIQALAQDHGRINDRRDQAASDVADLLDDGDGFDKVNEIVDAPKLAEALMQAVERATARGDLEALKGEALAEVARLERQAEQAARALPLWSRPLAGLEMLAIPSAATLDRFEVDLAHAEEVVRRVEAEHAALEAERATLDREIGHARHVESVPTQADLIAARAARDAAWQGIRGQWAGPGPINNPSAIANDYEAAVRAADDLADRLRREADLVARQAQRQLRRREVEDRGEALVREQIQAREDHRKIHSAWVTLWQAAGIAPLSPREMKDWAVRGHASLARQAQGVRERRGDAEALEARIEQHKAELGRWLGRLGEVAVDPCDPLDAVLDRARGAVERVAIRSKVEVARAALARAEADRLAWRGRWAEAVATLGLNGDAAPAEAHAIIRQWEELAAKAREVRDARSKLEELDRDRDRFEAAVVALRDRLILPDGPGTTAEARARDLADRLDRAKLDRARREAMEARRVEEQGRLADAKGSIDRAEGTIAALLQEARRDAVEDLVEAERLSDEVKALRKDLHNIDEQLSILAGNRSVERLCGEATGVDVSSLEIQIQAYADRLNPLERRRDLMAEEIGRFRERLDAMDGGPRAADARQEVEGRVAALTADVEKYARLRLALSVLVGAVERHRARNQGAILDRAGGLFARLTAGSFAGLRADVDEKGNPMLRGLRGDGATLVAVEGMSEGTADQLYLALRLASLEAYIEHHEPMPLIVDDILVHFDNARASAALQALAELSTRTQVLFFTHHEHLVDLARLAVEPEILFVHRLGADTADTPARRRGLLDKVKSAR